MTDYMSMVDGRRDEILNFLKRIVKMESPSDEKDRVDALIDVLESHYKDLGFSTRRLSQKKFGDHLVADITGEDGPRILLVGHADTVYPLGVFDKMPLRVDGDRLLGPGVMDMKGGLTAMAFGVQTFLDAGNSLRGSIRVVVNSDEEPGSPTSKKWWEKLTEDVDYALILEPAKPDGELSFRRKGVGIFYVDVKGKSAHAGAEPEKGASAIRVLAEKLIDIEDLADLACGTTINTGVITGGTHPYVVPESARAEIDIRIPTLAEKDRILRSMKTIVEREDLTGTSAVLDGEFHRPPLEPAEGFDAFKQIIEEEGRSLGVPIQWFGIAGGASDGNNISACGVPTIDGMGPAGAGAHSPEEYMEIPSLFQKTALLSAVLDRILGVKT